MKDSIKANLIVFLIIAVIAFGISSAFAALTIHEDNDSYKLIAIDNDSFNPDDVDYVPTIKPKNKTTNTTNTTNTTVWTNVTEDINDSIDDFWNDSEEWIESWSD